MSAYVNYFVFSYMYDLARHELFENCMNFYYYCKYFCIDYGWVAQSIRQ